MFVLLCFQSPPPLLPRTSLYLYQCVNVPVCVHILPRGTDTTVSQQEVEILEEPSTIQKPRDHQLDVMEIVRDLQSRIEVKKEVMEEEQHKHARCHAQLQSVVEAKIQEGAGLRGRLNDNALTFECTLCFEKLGAGSVLGTPTATGLLVGLVW